MEGPLAAHVVSKFEQSNEGVQFKRVDSDIIDKLIEKDDAETSLLDEKQQETLTPILQEAFPGDGFELKFAAMSPTSAPITITISEWMRRMKEQQAVLERTTSVEYVTWWAIRLIREWNSNTTLHSIPLSSL